MKLQQNEGAIDRIIRVIIGIGLLTGGFWGLTGVVQIIAYVLGIVAIGTGLVGFCGLYVLFGISTYPVKKK
ncbi:MAG: DUF2892 domain-containing protein [bacterium]